MSLIFCPKSENNIWIIEGKRLFNSLLSKRFLYIVSMTSSRQPYKPRRLLADHEREAMKHQLMCQLFAWKIDERLSRNLLCPINEKITFAGSTQRSKLTKGLTSEPTCWTAPWELLFVYIWCDKLHSLEPITFLVFFPVFQGKIKLNYAEIWFDQMSNLLSQWKHTSLASLEKPLNESNSHPTMSLPSLWQHINTHHSPFVVLQQSTKM